MKVRYIILFCLLFLQFPFLGNGQQLKMTFPYELVGDKMVVKVQVNGVEKRFIFDTGAKLCMVSQALLAEAGLQDTLVQRVVDANNREMESRMAVLDHVLFVGTQTGFQGFRALVMDKNVFECFGADGLIGSELLSQTIMTIDGQAKTVTLTSAEQAPRLSLRESRPFAQSGVMPIIETTWGRTGIPVLFDTGFGGFLKMRPEDFQACTPALEVLAEGIQEGSFSVSGKAANTASKRVKVDPFKVCMGTFHNLIVETAPAPHSLLGMKLLEYGKVTIDYPRQRFYYEPYERETELENPLNDYSLKVTESGELVVSTVWSTETSGIQSGDRVLKINGKPVGKYDFCESITVGLPALKEKAKNMLEVETSTGVKKVIYRYNKKKDKK